jgi:hypothetical protein
MTNKVKMEGVQHDFHVDSGGLYNKRSQEIPQSFLDSLREQRINSTNQVEGDYMRVASIPTVIVEKWMREGFNIFDQNVDGKDIIKRLKAEGLDAFLTTEKSI